MFNLNPTSGPPKSLTGLPSVLSYAPPGLRNLFFPRPVSFPQLPPSRGEDYTLVLDLDETLLHTQWVKGDSERFVVHERPFVREFLRSLKKLPFEVIIFTAGIQGYADTVIDIMDRDTRAISHRLYRQHTTTSGWQRWKDLGLLNRNLARTVIVDNSPEVFRFHANNGIPIGSWEGHYPIRNATKQFEAKEDFALINLFFWLEFLVEHKMDIPEFVNTHKAELGYCLGRSTRDAPVEYIPPFNIGPLSNELLQRCFPNSPARTEKKISLRVECPTFRENIAWPQPPKTYTDVSTAVELKVSVPTFRLLR